MKIFQEAASLHIKMHAYLWKYAQTALHISESMQKQQHQLIQKLETVGGLESASLTAQKKFQEIQIKELCQRAQPYNIQKSIFPISIKQFEFLLDKTILISNIWNKI